MTAPPAAARNNTLCCSLPTRRRVGCRKEIVSLRESLEAASAEDTQERAEAGAGRSNIKLPKLSQHRSVAAALSLVARSAASSTLD